MIEIKRALLSCWDKSGLESLGRFLATHGIEILSSGGTASFLTERGIPVTSISEITGFPEILNGRVKTLHPKIFGGILATDSPEHQKDLASINGFPIQLVVVNLYPFTREAVEKNLPLDEAIEYIDIGGPSLLRAAAKNFRHVVGLFAAEQFQEFMKVFSENGGKIPYEYSLECAKKIFFHTSWYDSQISAYLENQQKNDGPLPRHLSSFLVHRQELRYGENPHQAAAVYAEYGKQEEGLAALEQLWGKQLSFNNYLDVYSAYQLVLSFSRPACVIVKHTNPCGAARTDESLLDAFERAFRGDPKSAFGGIVAFNRPVDKAVAEKMVDIFFECIIAPDFSDGAVEIFRAKKNLRLLKLTPDKFKIFDLDFKVIDSIYLVQESDRKSETPVEWKVVSRQKPTKAQLDDLEFAWKVVKQVKSNAIVLAKEGEIYGVGAGQMSRVDAVEFAIWKAQQVGRNLKGAVLASDAFFPFRDSIDRAAEVGIAAIVQPGGSIRDSEVIQAADEHQIAMLFTGTRHFKH